MINIVIDYNLENFDLHADILFLAENYDLSEIKINNRPILNKLNLFYIIDAKSEIINKLSNNYEIKIFPNNFLLNLSNNSPNILINKILEYPVIKCDNPIKRELYKKNKSIKNLSFFIREDSKLINIIESFLRIISIYYDFEWSFNNLIENSICIHVLTPAKDDINGISITQLIMSLQRNQFPISNIYEPVFENLYIPYELTLESFLNLIVNLSKGSYDLKSMKNLFENYDFSNLFK